MTNFEDFKDRLSETSAKILRDSEQISRSLGKALDSEHLLIALSNTAGTISYETLRNLMVNPERILNVLRSNSQYFKPSSGVTEDMKRILKGAFTKASQFQSASVDSEHLLLSLLSIRDCNAYRILLEMGIDPKLLYGQINQYLANMSDATDISYEEEEDDEDLPQDNQENASSSSSGMPGGMPFAIGGNLPPGMPKARSAIEYFTTDLTKLAKQNKLDPVIGRAKEMQRVIQILIRRTKNNPVLVGEAGVGKTAIVEGIAQKIAAGDVPRSLSDKRVLSLDLALLISGTSYRGQFEDRVKKLVDEILKAGNVILFLDELHTIVGAGAAEGSMDLSNILKPALAKCALRLIGATTNEEYRKYIEKDPALERRLQKVIVEEPTIEEAIAILSGLKSAYESHHNVIIDHEALVAAVEMSERYINDRFLPDKAIDLIDEASAATQLEEKQLKIYNKIVDLEKKQAHVSAEHQKARDNFDYAKAAEYRVLELRLIDEINKLKSRLPKRTKTRVITREDIARVVSMWTGIPVTTLSRSEQIRIADVQSILKKHIVGQGEAIDAIASVIKRSSAGISDPNRPLGSFIFLGPTGVGKTELARVLAKEVYGRDEALVKIDMSEFMERHNVSRLVGAPPGYVGYEEAGKLTETIRRQPYSVVLLDEIEKAHPDTFNMLLQIMEDGYLTDAKGRRVNFRHTILIMTSNIGMAELNRHAKIGFSTSNDISEDERYKAIKEKVQDELKEHFRPEFLNRLDKVIIFHPLSRADIEKIVELQIERLKNRLLPEGIDIQIEESAKSFLAEKGYDPQYGARGIRRVITQYIEDPLSQLLLTGKLSKNSPIRVLRKGEKLALVK